MPYEQRMLFEEFVDFFFASRGSSLAVPYLQHQNSNLTEEAALLVDDVDAELAWASKALGGPPDAVNLWIGDDRSETSFHKDHYENLYAVVAGEKEFTLLPPADVWRLYLTQYPRARFTPSGPEGVLQPVLERPQADVAWCPVEPYPKGTAAAQAAKDRWPFFFDESLPPPLVVRVAAGDVLYLPAMWHHYVRQTPTPSRTADWVVAVNYWHDMRFDVKYAYFGFVERLVGSLGTAAPGGVKAGALGVEQQARGSEEEGEEL